MRQVALARRQKHYLLIQLNKQIRAAKALERIRFHERAKQLRSY
jgi:hypothetical protein